MYYCMYVCISSEFVENCTHPSPWGCPILRACIMQYAIKFIFVLKFNGSWTKTQDQVQELTFFQRFYMKFRQILSNFSWSLGNFQVIFHFSLMIFILSRCLLSHQRDITTFCPYLDSYQNLCHFERSCVNKPY